MLLPGLEAPEAEVSGTIVQKISEHERKVREKNGWEETPEGGKCLTYYPDSCMTWVEAPEEVRKEKRDISLFRQSNDSHIHFTVI